MTSHIRSEKKQKRNTTAKNRQRLNNASSDTRLKRSGLGGTKQVEEIPNYVQAECETVVKGSTNSWVVLGRDRPATRLSGVGAGIDSHCSMIDLCVGRGGRDVVTEDNERLMETVDHDGNPATPELKFFNNDFKADAARIYISQKTSIDKNFGLVPGKIGNYDGQLARSAIGIKADNIRMIARHGIKLVTRTDDTYSTGGSSSGEVKGINIIAGNDDSDLQPMVKGRNLRALLRLICEDLRTTSSAVHDLVVAQMAFNNILAAHVHVDPVSGVTGPSVEVGVAASLKASREAIQIIPSQINEIINRVVEDIEFLLPAGSSRSILSKHNHVN